MHSDAVIGTGLPGVADRVLRALLTSCLLVPTMFLAHVAVAGSAPTIRAAVVAGLAVPLVLVVCAGGPGGPVLAAATSQLFGQALLALPVDGPVSGSHGCLPVVGRGAEVGLRLALFQQTQECPAGTLEQGSTTTAAVASVVSAAAVLLAHALAAVCGPAAADRSAAALRRAAVLLGGLRTPWRPLPIAVPTCQMRIHGPSGPARPRSALVLGRTGRRGPPVLVPA